MVLLSMWHQWQVVMEMKYVAKCLNDMNCFHHIGLIIINKFHIFLK